MLRRSRWLVAELRVVGTANKSTVLSFLVPAYTKASVWQGRYEYAYIHFYEEPKKSISILTKSVTNNNSQMKMKSNAGFIPHLKSKCLIIIPASSYPANDLIVYKHRTPQLTIKRNEKKWTRCVERTNTKQIRSSTTSIRNINENVD